MQYLQMEQSPHHQQKVRSFYYINAQEITYTLLLFTDSSTNSTKPIDGKLHHLSPTELEYSIAAIAVAPRARVTAL